MAHSVGPRLLAAGIAALGLAHILYLRFICDDAFISFRYAAHLVRGDGLVYNAGQRVEGYTNFLWTLISASMLEAGVRPEAGTMVLGGACALATLIVAIEFCRRRGWSPWLAGTLIAASGAWAAWGTSGLETAAFTLLVTSGTLSVVAAFVPRDTESRPSRAPLAGAVLLALAALTRPEGLLVSAIVLAFLLWSVSRRRLDARAALASLGVWAAMVGPHLAWRLAYYGRWLPNTLAAKSGGPGALEAGVRYLGHAMVDLALYVPVLVIVTSGVMPSGRAPSGRRPVAGAGLALVACVVVPYLILVVSTGGDFMPLYRFVVPVIPLLAVWAAASWTSVSARLAGARARTVGVGVIAVLASVYALVNLAQSRRQQDSWTRGDMESVGYTRQDAENWRRVGELLAKVTLPTDTLATTAAGIIPYVSDLTTIDLLGLAAPDLSLYRRRDTARPGHTLMLSGDALDRMRPQILIGHPLVMPTMEHLGLSLDFEPEWRERVLASYSLFGLTLIGKPVRFTGLVLRNDVAERILAAGQRLGGVDTTGAIER